MILFMKRNQNQCQLPPSTVPTDTLLTCPGLLNLPQDQGAIHGEFHLLHQQQQQQKLDYLLLIGGKSDNSPVLDQKQQLQPNDPPLSIGELSNQPQLDKNNHGRGSVKMRLMKKKMGADKHQIIVTKERRPPSFDDQTELRVCSDCNTTKTPLWRSGPQGPKSLCNACGIRRMKARRAMTSEVDRTIPFKKRFKMISSSSDSCAQKKLLRFDEVTINKLGCSQAFPQEERDAAILLMALSCGLIHG